MKKRIKSFHYAFKGIGRVSATQVNFRIHLAAAALASGLGFWLEISRMEWVAVLLCFAAVMSAEAMNSAVEGIVDFISPEFHEKAGHIKDMAAGAVLISAIVSAVVGLIIFLPKLSERLG